MYFLQWPVWWICEAGSNEDESRWKLAGESLHECFHNSSLLGQTSSESCMRVFLLFSISLFLLVASTLPISSFFDACQTTDSPSHYSNCHLSMIRHNIFFFFFFFLWVMIWKSPACFCISLWLSCSSHDGQTSQTSLKFDDSWWEMMRVGGETSQTSHGLSKFESAQSWWECMRVDESWRSNESESCDSHSLSSSFDQAL